MGFINFLSQPNSRHHYAFAHYGLRYAAFQEPVRIFGMLASNERTRFFDHILQDLDTRIEGPGRRNFSGKDVGFEGLSIAGRPCAILEMPPTTSPAEAYFVAILGRLPLEELADFHEQNPGEPAIDYYTLERPIKISRSRPSVFCAWTEDAHLNFGEGPEPTLEKFAKFLSRHVQST